MLLQDTPTRQANRESRETRLTFHQASGHLGQRGPGYYLILLRSELRHRTLRRKTPAE